LAFNYLLTQRLWDLSIWSNAETFWTHFKKRISSPEHRCVRFMMTTKKRFLRMMEREMFDTDCEAWSQALLMGYSIGSDTPRQFPPTALGYDENHPEFNDEILTFNAWLLVEDRGDKCLQNIFDEQDGKLQDLRGDGFRDITSIAKFPQRRRSDPGATSSRLLAKAGSFGVRSATTGPEIGRPVEQTASNYAQATRKGEDVDMKDPETVHPESMLINLWIAAPVLDRMQAFNPITSRKRAADFDSPGALTNERCWHDGDIEMGYLVDDPQSEERASKRQRLNGPRYFRLDKPAG
jgi:hypothetical protein